MVETFISRSRIVEYREIWYKYVTLTARQSSSLSVFGSNDQVMHYVFLSNFYLKNIASFSSKNLRTFYKLSFELISFLAMITKYGIYCLVAKLS